MLEDQVSLVVAAYPTALAERRYRLNRSLRQAQDGGILKVYHYSFRRGLDYL